MPQQLPPQSLLEEALREAKEAHTKYEASTGPDPDWPKWYASFMYTWLRKRLAADNLTAFREKWPNTTLVGLDDGANGASADGAMHVGASAHKEPVVINPS